MRLQFRVFKSPFSLPFLFCPAVDVRVLLFFHGENGRAPCARKYFRMAVGRSQPRMRHRRVVSGSHRVLFCVRLGDVSPSQAVEELLVHLCVSGRDCDCGNMYALVSGRGEVCWREGGGPVGGHLLRRVSPRMCISGGSLVRGRDAGGRSPIASRFFSGCVHGECMHALEQ